MLNVTENFAQVKEQIDTLIATREDREVDTSVYNSLNPLKITDFAEDGISQTATKLQYPAQFVIKLGKGDDEHQSLANEIINLKYKDYFKNTKREEPYLNERRFNGKIYGMLSERYAFFDDDEILPMISKSSYLMNSKEYWYDISPRHTHLRFVSDKKLDIKDDSPLSMCVFLDNSMIGFSSFRIRFGLFRWACTNGMISGLKEFEILRETHAGDKDFTTKTLEALEEIPTFESMLVDQVERMQETKSMIYAMDEEDAKDKIKSYLNTTKKVAESIFKLYEEKYDGRTEWDLCNAITDAAHTLPLESRLTLERKAFVSKAKAA